MRIWSSKDRKQVKIIKNNLDTQGKELQVNQKTKDLNDAALGRSIDISPDGKFIAVGFKEGTVKVRSSYITSLRNKYVLYIYIDL